MTSSADEPGSSAKGYGSAGMRAIMRCPLRMSSTA
jgi:hypothetical protein